MACKRRALSIHEKVRLIRLIEKGENKTNVAKRFGFSLSTVSTIWKNKEKILQAEMDGKSLKKLKKPKFENLDNAMLSWFCKQRQNNTPVSGPIMKAKAEKFAKQLNITDFKASEGWLGKFKKRHHISYGKMEGKARNVDIIASNDIIDKTGICNRLRPDKTFQFKEENCVGSNLSKERITVLIAGDINYTEETASLTDEEIPDSPKKSEKEEDKVDYDLEPPPSIKEAWHAVKLLQKFILINEFDPTVSQYMDIIQRNIQLKYISNKNNQS